MTADVIRFPDRAAARELAAARRLEAAAKARHDWVAEHRNEFVRLAREAAAAARAR